VFNSNWHNIFNLQLTVLKLNIFSVPFIDWIKFSPLQEFPISLFQFNRKQFIWCNCERQREEKKTLFYYLFPFDLNCNNLLKTYHWFVYNVLFISPEHTFIETHTRSNTKSLWIPSIFFFFSINCEWFENCFWVSPHFMTRLNG
jgi:hypothetical protein